MASVGRRTPDGMTRRCRGGRAIEVRVVFRPNGLVSWTHESPGAGWPRGFDGMVAGARNQLDLLTRG